LPQENQKTITIRKDIYNIAEKQAKKQKKSVAKLVTELIVGKCEDCQIPQVVGEQKSKEA